MRMISPLSVSISANIADMMALAHRDRAALLLELLTGPWARMS
jgi:hypothetical protein